MQIAHHLGADSQGDFYLAEHPRLGRQVLKVVALHGPAADRGFVDQLLTDARAAASLPAHPTIATITDFGVIDGSFWYTMAPFDATDLRSAQLNDADLAVVISEIAAALDYAHRGRVLHRDVRAGNIVVSREPASGALVSIGLMNLGLGRLSARPGQPLEVAYPAPEVLAGAPPSPAADQYALACTAFELLTGRSPAQDIRVTDARPERAALDPTLVRALNPDPAQRFPYCQSFAAEFARTLYGYSAVSRQAATVAGTPAQLRPISQPPAPAPAPRKRKPLLVGLILAAVVLLAGASIATWLTVSGEDDSQDTATPQASATPEVPDGPTVTDVAMGPGNTCAVADAEWYCWGSGNDGSKRPTKFDGISDVTAVAVGHDRCAVAGGEVYCVGLLSWDVDAPIADSPVKIEGLRNVTDISIYGWNVCAVSDGDVYCWGSSNREGQLGVEPSEDPVSEPTRVEGLGTVSEVKTKVKSTCALSEGQVFCWGNQNPDPFNPDADDPSPTPVRIPGIEDATGLADSSRACALTTKRMRCWNGMAPPADTLDPPPTVVTEECAVSGGLAYCWSLNDHGQRGVGDEEAPWLVATAVSRISNVTDIATEGNSNCAIANDRLYCWGANSDHQLGDGTTEHRNIPTFVVLGK